MRFVMRPVIPALLCASLALSACAQISQSRFNPLNWFGTSEAVATGATAAEIRPLVPENAADSIIDTRSLVASVSELSVDRTPDGAIVRAVGTTAVPGQFNAELIATSIDNGVLDLAFRVQSPATDASSRVEPRRITAAYILDNRMLSQVRTIRVSGAQNSLTTRR